MPDWWTRLTPPLLLVGSLIALALMLSGCAAHLTPSVEQPAPLPEVLKAPSSPSARAYSEKVSTFFQRVESWLSARQLGPTR